MQEVAEEKINEEMWPRVSARGYQENLDEDTWDAGDDSFVRYGTLTVPGRSKLLDELRHLANASLTETWDV